MTGFEVPAPAYLHRPPHARSMLGPVDKLATALGRPLDDAQRTAVDALTGLREDGRPASLEAAVIAPRQNLKTWIMQLIVLIRLLEPGGDRLIVWSAHLFDTAQETFGDFLELIETHPWLDDLVQKVDRGNGEEQITFPGRRRLRFRARAKTGGRGLAGDCVVLDEAFALKAAHMGALLPILSTRRRALVLYGSSAGMTESAVLRDVRDRGRKGRPGAPAYAEWCAPGSLTDPGCADPVCRHDPGTAGCVLDDQALWVRANPAAASGRISMDYLIAERNALTVEEFARERMGWWEDPSVEALDLEAWRDSADPNSIPRRVPIGLAVVVAPKGRSASVVAAGRRDDGLVHVEILEQRPGMDWLAAWARAKCVDLGWAPLHYLGGKNPTAAVVPALQKAQVPLVKVSETDYAGACDSADQMVRGGLVRHLGDPRLTAGLEASGRRDVGDGAWVMTWKGAMGAIAAAGMAVPLALHALGQAGQYSDDELTNSFG